MDKVQQIVPITEMRLRHAEVLERLNQGPVILAQRSKPAAVLVAVEMWDRIANYIEDLEATVDALDAELKLARGEATSHILTETELNEWLREDAKVPA